VRREVLQPAQPTISVIIPVFRSSGTLGTTLDGLLRDDYPNKEIIVEADEPTEGLKELAGRFSPPVRFIMRKERAGKVNALKDACALATGDILLFLDSDIVIRTDGVLSKVVNELRGYDLLELKKSVVEEGMLSKMVYYEYVGFNVANWVLSRRMNKTLGVNGAGFAITREAYERIGGFRNVISEDLDLGLRGYLRDLKFRYAEDIEVATFAPSSLKRWWAQRKRWSYGAAIWLRDNRRELLYALRRHPGVILSALLLIFPALASFMFSLTFKELAVYDVFVIALLSVSPRGFPMVIPPFLPIGALPDLMGLGIATLVGLAGYAILYVGLGWRLGYRFRVHHFIPYYLFYSPMWLAAMAWGLITVFVRKEEVQIDWKV